MAKSSKSKKGEHTRKIKLASFNSLEQEVMQIVDELHEYSGLKKSVIQNIVSFSKCLVKPDTDVIDELIFTAELVKQFEITDKVMLARIYTVVKEPKHPDLSIFTFAKCVVTLLSTNLELLTRFVFNVYDINQDGALSAIELYQLLKPCVIPTENDEIDHDENVGDIVEIVVNSTDLDRNGNISMEEYLDCVKKDILLLQLLGKCLPSDKSAKEFIARMTGKSPMQIRQEYANERALCLKELTTSRTKSLYPFKLELP